MCVCVYVCVCVDNFLGSLLNWIFFLFCVCVGGGEGF